jgi:hypothetical protein
LTNKLTILFVHSGQASPPACMVDSVAIACQVASSSNVLVLVNESQILYLQNQVQIRHQIQPLNLQWISIESLGKFNLSSHFLENSKADRDFRGGFWLQTANRFMLIADLMLSLDLENCLHLENDNILYFDPSSKLDVFRKHARFSIPFDRSRAIPGIVWYKDAKIAFELAKYMAVRSDLHDFDVIRQFCDSKTYDAKPLPTMSLAYAVSKNLSIKNYCDGYKQFGGVFDAAAIGQYIGGVDPRNIEGDSRFFINETSDLNMSECNVSWDYDQTKRYLMLNMQGEDVKVLSLHAHSKDSLGVSPYNRLNIRDKKSIITGERLQEMAELTITSKEITAFHGLDNIRTNRVLTIPKKNVGNFFRKRNVDVSPGEKWLEECKSAKIIFVYSHLLNYFKKYILKRLDSPFTLISHNSDNGVGIEYLDILNYPFLEKWYAQNCEINHKKLRALPIGLTNRQWGEEKIAQLLKTSLEHRKTRLVLANFSAHTHPSRKALLSAISELSFISRSQNLQYEVYLEELAQHQFCICPRGNGVDTHRFWEAQYLNTIPIIIMADWTPAYSGLPILVLENWDQLKIIDLQKEFIRISSTYFHFGTLDLLSYKMELTNPDAKLI